MEDPSKAQGDEIPFEEEVELSELDRKLGEAIAAFQEATQKLVEIKV